MKMEKALIGERSSSEVTTEELSGRHISSSTKYRLSIILNVVLLCSLTALLATNIPQWRVRLPDKLNNAFIRQVSMPCESAVRSVFSLPIFMSSSTHPGPSAHPTHHGEAQRLASPRPPRVDLPPTAFARGRPSLAPTREHQSDPNVRRGCPQHRLRPSDGGTMA